MSEQMRTRVKICGLTREEDVDAAVQAGTDAIGLVFYAPSKRAISIERAQLLRARVPAFVSVVALFVNAPEHEVRTVLDKVQPDLLQFHGDESPEYCASFGHRYIRGFRIGGPGLDSAAAVAALCQPYASASAWLFDSYSAGFGGSGLSFDADLLNQLAQSSDTRPLILAGGLKPESVTASIARVQPFAVDVSSGVECSPGLKSHEKIQAFIDAVRMS